MKHQSKFSYVGYGIGFLFILFAGIRYFLLYPDTDRALVYVGLGIIIMAIAWLYSQNLDSHNKITAIEDYLADLKGGNE